MRRLAVFSPSGEPAYGGRTLSQWVLRTSGPGEPVPGIAWFYAHPPEMPSEIGDALQHIGTSAIPYLLRWIRYEQRGLKSKVVPALVNTLRDNRWRVREAAIDGLERLRAGPAVPALVALLTDPDARMRNRAADALRIIDPEALERTAAR